MTQDGKSDLYRESVVQHGQHVPISTLQPFRATSSEQYIRATTTLIWPYSKSDQSAALMLAEPDFRLRKTKGQIRVQFHGSAAVAIGSSKIAIGDTINLSLTGARWVERGTTIRTPGPCVDAELMFKHHLHIDFEDVSRQVKACHVSEAASPHAPPTVPTTPPMRSRTAKDALDTRKSEWPTPSRFRDSLHITSPYTLMPGVFKELNDGSSEPAYHKRTKYGRRSSEWRYVGAAELDDAHSTIQYSKNQFQVCENTELDKTTPARASLEDNPSNDQVSSTITKDQIQSYNNNSEAELLPQDKLSTHQPLPGTSQGPSKLHNSLTSSPRNDDIQEHVDTPMLARQLEIVARPTSGIITTELDNESVSFSSSPSPAIDMAARSDLPAIYLHASRHRPTSSARQHQPQAIQDTTSPQPGGGTSLYNQGRASSQPNEAQNAIEPMQSLEASSKITQSTHIRSDESLKALTVDSLHTKQSINAQSLYQHNHPPVSQDLPGSATHHPHNGTEEPQAIDDSSASNVPLHTKPKQSNSPALQRSTPSSELANDKQTYIHEHPLIRGQDQSYSQELQSEGQNSLDNFEQFFTLSPTIKTAPQRRLGNLSREDPQENHKAYPDTANRANVPRDGSVHDNATDSPLTPPPSQHVETDVVKDSSRHDGNALDFKQAPRSAYEVVSTRTQTSGQTHPTILTPQSSQVTQPAGGASQIPVDHRSHLEQGHTLDTSFTADESTKNQYITQHKNVASNEQASETATICVSGRRSYLSYFAPLQRLREYLNASSQSLDGPDILAIVSSELSEPLRMKKGTKDWKTMFYVSDESSYPQSVRVEMYRPHLAALPSADIGDVILLRSFDIKSSKRHPFLISSAASSWYVVGCSGRTDWVMPGNHVELGDEERKWARSLQRWWAEQNKADDES